MLVDMENMEGIQEKLELWKATMEEGKGKSGVAHVRKEEKKKAFYFRILSLTHILIHFLNFIFLFGHAYVIILIKFFFISFLFFFYLHISI